MGSTVDRMVDRMVDRIVDRMPTPALSVALAMCLLAPISLTTTALAQDGTEPFFQRYMIEGRVIGANELPLAEREVRVTVVGEELTTPCEGGHRNTTDAWGDFRFCWLHGKLASGARAEIAVGNVTRTIQLDPTFRRSYTPLQDATQEGTAPPAWNETYLLTGRAWTARPVIRGDMTLIGLAVPHLPVNLTVTEAGVVRTENATTDEVGDFSFTVATADARNTTVVVELGGQGQTGILDPTWHRSHTPYIVRAFEDFSGVGSAGEKEDAAPGSATPSVSPWLILAGALALVVTVVLAARAKKPK